MLTRGRYAQIRRRSPIRRRIRPRHVADLDFAGKNRRREARGLSSGMRLVARFGAVLRAWIKT